MLLQFAFLGRALAPEQFATFLLAYSLAAIFSQAADGGQHVTLFSALRSGQLLDATRYDPSRNRTLDEFGASVAWAVVVLLIGLVVPSLDTRLVLIALALGVAVMKCVK